MPTDKEAAMHVHRFPLMAEHRLPEWATVAIGVVCLCVGILIGMSFDWSQQTKEVYSPTDLAIAEAYKEIGRLYQVRTHQALGDFRERQKQR